MSKKRPLPQRIAHSLLGKLEREFPKLSRLLSYHSIVEWPSRHVSSNFYTKKARWFDAPYREALNKIAYDHEFEGVDFHNAEQIPVSILHTDDYFILGHVKAPICRSTGKLLSYSPLQRVTLTDAYPRPSPRKKIVLSGAVIFIPNIENYFHLLVDYLLPPIASLIREPTRYSNVNFVIQRQFPLINFFISILKSRGIDSKTIELKKHHQVSGGALIIGAAEPRDAACAFVYEDELEMISEEIDANLPLISMPKRFYVKRTGTPRRLLKNEQELIKILETFNVVPVELDYHRYLEQIALFRNAELIISVHGAALANLIWSKKAKVIELFPQTSRPKHYIHIAAQMGLEYHAIIGSPGDKKDSFNVNINEIIPIIGKN